MKRIAALLLVAACAPEAPPPVSSVRLSAAAPRAVEAASGTLLAECQIVGTGDRVTSARPFAVFPTQASPAPALVVAGPTEVHLAWSRFPSRPSEAARARVELGGQAHVRFAGWSELRGRTFSAKRRMYAERGHLWARVGASIQMAAVEDGVAIASVATPYVSPKTLSVRGGCEAIAYDAEPPENEAAARGGVDTVVNRNVAIDLYASPSGRPFVGLVLGASGAESLRVLARRDGFVRVTAEDGDVGFDAWVPEGQTSEYVGYRSGSGYGYGSSHCGGRGWYERGTVTKDSPLFVGESPEGLAGAVVEKGATIAFRSRDAKTVGGAVLVPFDFDDRIIAAPEGQQLWIAKDVIGPD